MAQKLLQQGEEIPLLFLIEPPGVCFPLTTVANTSSPKNGSFSSRVVYQSRKLARMPLGHMIPYALRKLPNVFNFIITRKAKKKIKMAICNVYCCLGRPLPLSLREFYIFDIYRNAMQKYTPNYTSEIALVFRSVIRRRRETYDFRQMNFINHRCRS
jgi:hypothetical protein